MSLRDHFLISLGAVALCAFTGCWQSDRLEGGDGASSAPTRAPAPHPLVVSVVGDPLTFNPIIADEQAGRAVGGAVFDTLVRLDPATATARPGLAKTWTYAPETHEYTLTLRDDVRWHDGEPLTARDVVFTVDAIHAAPNSPYARILRIDDQPVRATAPSPTTVRFALPRPYAPFVESLVIPIIPAHKLGAGIADGRLDRVADQWGVDVDPAELVGTGPFRLAAYVPGQRIVLERNDAYWRHDEAGESLPYLDRYILRIAPDRETVLDWFRAGAIHIFSPRFDEVATLRYSSAADEFVIEAVGRDTSSLFLTFNRNPLHYRRGGKTDPRFTWFNDPRFLRAVAHAIDKTAIIDGALGGLGVPARSLIPPANPFHSKLEKYGYNQDLARQILEDAGYTDRDKDGVREDSSKTPVKFTLTTNHGNTVREQIGKMVVDQLLAVGIQATLETLPFPDLFERLDATYDWDAMLIGFTVGVDPASSENLLRSDGDLHVWHPLQQLPATAWEAQIDDLVDQGTRALDRTQRREIYAEIQAILHKQLPMIHLVRPTLFAARRHGVENFHPSPWGFDRVEELRLREPPPEKSIEPDRR